MTRQLSTTGRAERKAARPRIPGVPASGRVVSSSLMMLLAAGGLAFAWMYATVHSPGRDAALGVTAVQPNEPVSPGAPPAIPPPRDTTQPATAQAQPASP